MTQEEKAKEFDASLERAKKLRETCDSTAVIGWCEYLFPELKESEDEKIRKEILAFIRREGQHIDKYKWHKWIAWFEKQGEQNYEFHGIAESRPAKGKLKELCQELSQSKVTKKSDQEWSEEDEEQVSIITDIVKAHCGKLIDCRANLKWLKSLKERLL